MSAPKFITMGPLTSCHDNALQKYLEFQGVSDVEIHFVEDWMEGLEILRAREDAYLLQCSAHPTVHTVTEKYWREVFVVDTFLYPTQEMALLRRAEVAQPRTLGLVPATAGYIDTEGWQILWEASKPIVGRRLLEGAYDAGLTYTRLAHEHPEQLKILVEIGAVDTTWILYGRRRRFQGQLIGQRYEDLSATTSSQSE